MKRNEKILLLLMGLGLLYVAYAFLFSGSTKLPTVTQLVNPDELKQIEEKVNKELQTEPLTDLERHKIAIAQASWSKSPFYDRREVVDTGQQPTGDILPQGQTLTYNGFVRLNDSLFAIISVSGRPGMEYQEGEELDIPGLFVSSITDKKIVVGQKDENGQILHQLEIFLVGDSL